MTLQEEKMLRYSRQVSLTEIGIAGQERLSAARVLVVGAGGLGCPVLHYLTAAGTGNIGIMDHDRVDLSNLQRQTLYTTADQGGLKALVAKERLSQLNPDISIKAYPEALTAKNALNIFSDYDIIIDGTDNFAAKFLLNDAAVKAGKPFVHGAIQGFDGQVSIFDSRQGPCYRCLHPHPPQDMVLNCAEAGVIGALAGIVGTVQAMETIKHIVKHDSFHTLVGKLWMVDTRTMESHVLTIPKQENCPTCSKTAAEIVLPSVSPACIATTKVAEIYPCEAAAETGVLFIDVRNLSEWEAGHIDGARHIPLSVLQKNPYAFIPPENGAPCILYCQKGGRSQAAGAILLNAGFGNIRSLKGGYEAWCIATRI